MVKVWSFISEYNILPDDAKEEYWRIREKFPDLSPDIAIEKARTFMKDKKELERCKACYPCSMGVVGCDDDRKPHGHGGSKKCDECGVLYYRVHPHSQVCSKAIPVSDDVIHDEHNLKYQLAMKGEYKI